jgi:hypothetical protein
MGLLKDTYVELAISLMLLVMHEWLYKIYLERLESTEGFHNARVHLKGIR